MSWVRPPVVARGATLVLATIAVAACSGIADVTAIDLPPQPDTGDFVPPDGITSTPVDAGVGPAFSPDGEAPGVAPAILVSAPSAKSTTEAGGTVTFTVRLATRPTADVIVPLSVTQPDEASITPVLLAFTAGDWSAPQTVTVTGKDDATADGDRPFAVALGTAASADPTYAGLTAPPVALTNRDDDTPGIEVSAASGATTTEAGGTVSFTVVLRSRPTAPVTVPVSVAEPAEATITSPPVVFGTDDWSTPRTVVVAGVDDDRDDGNQAFTVTIGAAESADATYAGRDPADIALVNVDDDAAGITVETLSATTTELGGTATVRVRLASRPTDAVTLPVSTSKPTEAVASGAVVITPEGWATPVTVTVTGVDDGTADGDQPFSLVIGAAVSADPLYAGKDPPDVAMTNKDRPRDGASAANASRTCATLKAAFAALPSGTYWIDPTAGATADAFQTTCDMTLDGGGWTMLGRGAWWLAEDDALAAGTMLGVARRASVVSASGKLFRLGTGASRLYVQDASARLEASFGYWRTDGAAVTCATTYAAVGAGAMANASVLAMSCDPRGVGAHTCGAGAANGWLLFREGDTYNPGATHPCAFGEGEQPTGGALLDLWVR